MDNATLLQQIANGTFVALVPACQPADTPASPSAALGKRWYSVKEVAEMLGYGVSKVKMLVLTGDLRSIKDGKYRRILPEWVDEYVNRRANEAA